MKTRLQDMGTTGLLDYIGKPERSYALGCARRLRAGQVARAMKTRGDPAEKIARMMTATGLLPGKSIWR